MKKILSLILLAFTIGVSSCDDDFLSLEENPNVPSVATPQFLLSGAQKVTADITNVSFSTFGVWVGYWTPSGNYVPNSALFTYNFTNTDYQVFGPIYNNLANYNALEKQAEADPSLGNFQAIAKIMKAYGFQNLVDIYNNVPYSEAFQGSANISPKYDKGEAIYDDLMVQLTSAIALINSSTSGQNPGTSDIIFGGDMASWKKFANTLKLRIALRQSNLTAKQAALKTAVAATAAEGYLNESVQAITQPGYENSDANGGKQSPFYRIYGFNQSGNATGNNDYYRASTYAVNKLSATNDLRVSRFYAPLPNGTVAGNVYGDPNARSNASVSGIGPGLLKSPTQPGVILSSAEALFLQAEALERGYAISGTAKDLYQKGITASFIAVGLTAAQATTYYTQDIANVSYDASTNKIEAIITQKWTALNGYNNLEAYNEYRRTGFPADVPRSVAAGALGSTLPTRIFYPASEFNQNATNVAAEGTINQFTSKIFWAK